MLYYDKITKDLQERLVLYMKEHEIQIQQKLIDNAVTSSPLKRTSTSPYKR